MTPMDKYNLSLSGEPKRLVRNILFDLSALLLAKEQAKIALTLLAKEGVKLFCYSALGKRRTRYALRRAGLLNLLDDVFFEDTKGKVAPQPFLAVNHPSLVSFTFLAQLSVPARRRPLYLTL